MLLSAGEIIKRSVDVYRANWGSIMRYVGLYIVLAIGLFVLAVIGFFVLGIGLAGSLNSGVNTDNPMAFMGLPGGVGAGLIVFGIIFLIAAIVFGIWIQVAMARTVRRAVVNQPRITIGEEMKESRPLIGRSFGSSLLVGIIVSLPLVIGTIGWMVSLFGSLMSGFSEGNSSMNMGGGTGLMIFFALLSIYGIFHAIYFGVKLTFSINSVMLDNKGITEGMTYSKSLVQGRWWGILWRTLAPMVLIMAPYYILSFLGAGGSAANLMFGLLGWVYYILLLIPLSSVVGIVLYENAKQSPITVSNVQ